ncbi:MAG: ROK family protein [Eubacterium sp.]|nr:ROK family protein [Eubacterium sp.]
MTITNKVKNYIGIDIGGTTVKGIITNYNGDILYEDHIATGIAMDGDVLSNRIVELINNLIMANGGFKSSFSGVGIGCPGLIDSKRGMVIFAGNLGLKYYPLGGKISENLGMPVKITNDANAAALGEAKFGAGKKYKDSILITLGTGVGGGIVINGKLFEGGNSAGTEIGHTVIVEDGESCTCGRKGCLEAYSSATALIRQTRRAMEENRNSLMWKTYNLDTVSGKTAFDYAKTDITAKIVIDNYIKHLACGIINLANIFRPQVVMLGGGVSNQKKNLTAPLQKILDKELFAGQTYAPVKVVTASLGNKAGALGAAALWL